MESDNIEYVITKQIMNLNITDVQTGHLDITMERKNEDICCKLEENESNYIIDKKSIIKWIIMKTSWC